VKIHAHVADFRDARASSGTARSSSGNAGVDLLLSEEGSFLRFVIVDELAKGLDAAARLSLDDAKKRLRTMLLGNAEGQRTPITTAETPVAVAISAAFASAPNLSDDADAEQMAGLQRLADLLQEIAREAASQRIQGLGAGGGGAAPASEGTGPLQAGAHLLQWAVSNVAALPPAQQQTLLRVPVEVASRLTSRAAARTLKLFLTGQDFQSI
jgi:aarF domain-containing kinase